MAKLPIHFFTIVLNGEPFIRYHLDRMKALGCEWHWHIVEGLAELKHDTAWSLRLGATVPDDVAMDGRSIDGTAEYLDRIAAENPGRVTVYRAPGGRRWDGKLEMVAAPLANLKEECLLWEVDSDELWTTAQFAMLRELFLLNPDRNAAIFSNHYFVGPELVVSHLAGHQGRHVELECRRAWRYRPGMRWIAHEPPVLGLPIDGGKFVDVASVKPFWPVELEQHGLVFQHFAYATAAQLRFKEKYYGYAGIVEQWEAMQKQAEYPVELRKFFNWPWVPAGAMVERVEAAGVEPLARLSDGVWEFPAAVEVSAPPRRGVLYVIWGKVNEAALRRSVASLQMHHPELPMHVARLPEGATLLDKSRMFEASPFDETLFLDIDTVVLSRLDFGFEMARRHGIACSLCENPWARRYIGLGGEMVEYNSGVVFFTRAAAPIFKAWKARVGQVDSTVRLIQDGRSCVSGVQDQAAFSLALAEAAHPPFVLPLNWNFRAMVYQTWYGPIKVWHDYREVPAAIAKFSARQAHPQSIVEYARIQGGKLLTDTAV